MPFTGSIEDRLTVREFYGAFAYASSRQASAQWLASWIDTCEWVTPHFSLTGKVALSAQWESLWENFDKVAVLCEVGSIEVAGDRAEVGCIVREIIRLKSGGLYKLVGIYEDVLHRENGKWRFAKRQYSSIAEEI